MMKKRKQTQIAAAEAIILYNNKFYFVPLFGKELYRMDKDYGNLICLVKMDEKQDSSLYLGIVGYGNKLYLIPRAAQKIAVYYLENGNVEYIEYRQKRNEIDNYSVFSDFSQNKNILYLIPASYSYLVRLNMETGEIENIRLEDTGGYICAGSCCVYKDRLYIPYFEKSCILEYSIKNRNIKKTDILDNSIVYSFLYTKNEILWAIPRSLSDAIVKLNLNTKEKTYFKTSLGKDLICMRMAVFDGSIYITTDNTDKNIKINMDSGEIQFWSISDKSIFTEEESWKTNIRQLKLFAYENELCLINGYTAEWFYLRGEQWEKAFYEEYLDELDTLRLDGQILPLNIENCCVKTKENNSSYGEKIYKQITGGL